MSLKKWSDGGWIQPPPSPSLDTGRVIIISCTIGIACNDIILFKIKHFFIIQFFHLKINHKYRGNGKCQLLAPIFLRKFKRLSLCILFLKHLEKIFTMKFWKEIILYKRIFILTLDFVQRYLRKEDSLQPSLSVSIVSVYVSASGYFVLCLDSSWKWKRINLHNTSKYNSNICIFVCWWMQWVLEKLSS